MGWKGGPGLGGRQTGACLLPCQLNEYRSERYGGGPERFQEKARSTMNPNPNASSFPPGESSLLGGSDPSPPPPKRRSCLWISVGCLGAGFLGLIVCCGIGTIGLQQQGHLIFEPVRMELNQMPDVTSEVGQIERLSMNF